MKPNKKSSNFEDALSEIAEKFQDDKKVAEFERSLAYFKRLISSGIIKERGNNLFSTSEITSHNIFFNIASK